ncbi:pseudouridine synthase [Candidatus Moduliflexus flocculans]|uniref:Pseudouridine synthase n=1 Tax=Candidatus Moduliflexus flocculans TaxID=1499966 RepID=A0A0S6VXE4_9BACT|nr:pseudouridine synthase [Candidatus Moduliflexus flocculans]
MELHTIIVRPDMLINADDAGSLTEKCRLDLFLMGQEEFAFSRSHLRKLIVDGNVTVNGAVVKTGYAVRAGDEIAVSVPPPRPLEVAAEAIPLNVLFEDAHLLVINKPAGMVVHPAPGHDSGTLVHGLLHHCDDLSGIGGVQRPGIVHRLDRDTSGVMIVAKNDEAHANLSAQLKSRELSRIYIALAHGRFRELTGSIDAPIGRHRTDRQRMAVDEEHGRNALSLYRVLEQFPQHTLVEVELKTGRTHQIRVHLKHIQHPVVGDPVYGSSSRNNLGMTRQALHAQTIRFRHPVTQQEMTFTTDLPDDMRQLLDKLRTQERA